MSILDRAPEGAAPSARRGFARTLLFGALAALGVPAVKLLGTPLVGSSGAMGLYLAALAVGYLAAIAGTARRAAAVTVLSLPAACVVLLLASRPAGVALGAAAIVALGRSAFLYRAPWPRLFVVETVLLVLGVGLARAVAVPGTIGAMLAVWTWFLVQSAWFLLARPAAGARSQPGDGFERARERLERLLDDWERNAT